MVLFFYYYPQNPPLNLILILVLFSALQILCPKAANLNMQSPF